MCAPNGRTHTWRGNGGAGLGSVDCSSPSDARAPDALAFRFKIVTNAFKLLYYATSVGCTGRTPRGGSRAGPLLLYTTLTSGRHTSVQVLSGARTHLRRSDRRRAYILHHLTALPMIEAIQVCARGRDRATQGGRSHRAPRSGAQIVHRAELHSTATRLPDRGYTSRCDRATQGATGAHSYTGATLLLDCTHSRTGV